MQADAHDHSEHLVQQSRTADGQKMHINSLLPHPLSYHPISDSGIWAPTQYDTGSATMFVIISEIYSLLLLLGRGCLEGQLNLGVTILTHSVQTA